MEQLNNQPSGATTHQIDFYNHDHEVQFSIVLTGVSEEKVVETAKGIYFASDEDIDHWDYEVKKDD